MKNLIKVFGLAAIVAVIAISMAALSLTSCGEGSYIGSENAGGLVMRS